MIQPQVQQTSEKDQRIESINSALNTITNLQTQLNGMSSQLSMILGNLGSLAGGLQDNIQFLVTDGNKWEDEVKAITAKYEDYMSKFKKDKDEKPKKEKPKKE